MSQNFRKFNNPMYPNGIASAIALSTVFNHNLARKMFKPRLPKEAIPREKTPQDLSNLESATKKRERKALKRLSDLAGQ